MWQLYKPLQSCHTSKGWENRQQLFFRSDRHFDNCCYLACKCMHIACNSTLFGHLYEDRASAFEKWSQCGNVLNLHYFYWPAGATSIGCNKKVRLYWVSWGNDSYYYLGEKVSFFCQQIEVLVLIVLIFKSSSIQHDGHFVKAHETQMKLSN